MKLRYDFEMMNVGDEITAVPVGENAHEFSGIINLNETSAKIIELIKESETPDEVLDKLLKLYPEEDRNQTAQDLCDFLNKLIKEGILIP